MTPLFTGSKSGTSLDFVEGLLPQALPPVVPKEILPVVSRGEYLYPPGLGSPGGSIIQYD